MKRTHKENLIRRVFCLSSLLSIFFLSGIVIVLFKEGLPIFRVLSLGRFLFGKLWYPTYEPADFGILPLLLGSFWVTAGALIVAVPLGIASAVYISEVAHPQIKEFIKPVIELLAGIPSVVYGFFGMVVVAPWVQKFFGLPVGLNAFTASILLGIMAWFDLPFDYVNIIALPIIIGIGVDDGVHLIHRYLIERRLLPSVASTGRAILLTTLTTLAGLIPMAYGWGGYEKMLSPMSLAFSWGLLFATTITLFLIPCLYMIINDIKK